MADNSSPKVSVLIATYNRADLLPRAVNSVLSQDFADFEIIIVDDHSTDSTPSVVAGFNDPRIRYIRNEINQGSKHGDRAHVRRCIYELMRGRYFVYLCDDDYWLPKDLLRRQVEAFERYPSLSMVMGGQAHVYLKELDDIGKPGMFFTYQLIPQVSATTYHTHGLFPAGFMTKYNFLQIYANAPMARNQLDGATLFSREALIRSKAFSSEEGSRWQAGYEFKAGPAAVGDVFYIDEPCVVAAMEPTNASYRGTQRQHYFDCIKSVDIACRNAVDALSADDRIFLTRIRKTFIHQLTVGYLMTRVLYKGGWFENNQIDHTHMFKENVTCPIALKIFRENGITITVGNVGLMVLASMPTFVLRGSAVLFYAWERTFGRYASIKRLAYRLLNRIPSDLSQKA